MTRDSDSSRPRGRLPTVDAQWPEQAIDIAAALRRQLDEATAKRSELEATIAELSADLQGKAEQLSDEPDALAREAQGSRFWYSAWTNANRHNATLSLRIVKLEGWAMEHGQEATKLQAELAAARDEIGELSRRLEDTERDYTEAIADREEVLGKLARCECGHSEGVH